MTQGNYPLHYPPPPPARYPQPPQYAANPYGGPAASPYGYPGAAGYYPPVPDKHSGLGIASSLLGFLAVAGLITTFVVAAIMGGDDPSVFDDENAPATIVVGLCVTLTALPSLVGVGLGIGGLAQKDHKKVFPMIGLISNGLVMLLIIGLGILGAAS